MPDDDVIARTPRLSAEARTATTFTEAEFTKDHDWIKRYLAKEMYITAFNVDESDRMFAQTDPEVDQGRRRDAEGRHAARDRQEDHRAAHEGA